MGRTPFFRTSIELERVHLLAIELEPNRAFTTFTKLPIELARTSFFRTSNELKHVHFMVIELEHPIVRPITIEYDKEHFLTSCHKPKIDNCETTLSKDIKINRNNNF